MTLLRQNDEFRRAGPAGAPVTESSCWSGICIGFSSVNAGCRWVMSRSFVPEIPGWVGVAAMVTGVALAVTAGTLPERWQDAALYLGVGLTFATVGGLLLNLAMAVRPAWRSLATVVGIVLGALPVVLVTWLDRHNGPETTPRPVRSHPVALVPARAEPVPQARPQPETAGAAAQQLEPVLAEVSDVLNKKARPALSRAVVSLMRVRALDPEAVKSQLTAATGDLEEVKTSLREIQSRHDEFRGELSSLIGNTSALDEAISRLRELRDSIEGAPDTLRRPGNEPRSVTAPVDEWIAGCNQRIADLRKTLGTAA
jgi:hypothetical protein